MWLWQKTTDVSLFFSFHTLSVWRPGFTLCTKVAMVTKVEPRVLSRAATQNPLGALLLYCSWDVSMNGERKTVYNKQTKNCPVKFTYHINEFIQTSMWTEVGTSIHSMTSQHIDHTSSSIDTLCMILLFVTIHYYFYYCVAERRVEVWAFYCQQPILRVLLLCWTSLAAHSALRQYTRWILLTVSNRITQIFVLWCFGTKMYPLKRYRYVSLGV